jgi:hypothetical protein
MGKIVCITNTYEDGDIIEGLTINKVYNIEKRDKALTDVVYIINDLDNYEGYYMDDFFITIDNWREQQLKKLI